MAVMVTGIVIIASVGGFIHVANSAGVFNSNVGVSGYVEGSNATTLTLYIDGAERAAETLDHDIYSQTDQRYYYFDYVKVTANRRHTFQVVTSDGEQSPTEDRYVRFGESAWISLNIEKPKATVTVRGYYNGTGTGYIYLQVDGQYAGDTWAEHGGTYMLARQVYLNQSHFFMVHSTYNLQNYTSSAEVLVTGDMTIWLNLP